MIMKRHLHVFLVALLWVIALPVSADEASVTIGGVTYCDFWGDTDKFCTAKLVDPTLASVTVQSSVTYNGIEYHPNYVLVDYNQAAQFTQLTTVNIPTSVTTALLEKLPALEAIHMDGRNEDTGCYTLNGVFWNGTNPTIPRAYKQTLVIPEGVETLTLREYHNMPGIELPATMTSLDLYDCPSLATFKVAAGNPVYYGCPTGDALYACSEELTYNEKKLVYFGCNVTRLEILDGTVGMLCTLGNVDEYIGIWGENLKEIVLPASLTEFYPSVDNLPNLERFIMDTPNDLYRVAEGGVLLCMQGDGTYNYYVPRKVKTITFPASTTDFYLSNLPELTSVSFPETATYISLTNCPNLASINVPKNVYRLGITGCDNIATMDIAADNERFKNVGGIIQDADGNMVYILSTVTSYTIPKDFAFSPSTFATYPHITTISAEEGREDGISVEDNVVYLTNDNTGKKYIYDAAGGLTQLNISADAYDMYYDYSSQRGYAFYCSYQTELPNLKTITVAEGNKRMMVIDGILCHKIPSPWASGDDDSYYIEALYAPRNMGENVVFGTLPESYYDDYDYAWSFRIGENLFRGYDKIKSVVLRGDIDYIDWNAFMECPNLERVDMSDAYVLEVLPNVMYGASKLKDILPPTYLNLHSISAFANTPWSRELQAKQDSAIYVGHALYGVKRGIQELVLDDWTYSVARGALNGGYYIKSLTLPANLTYYYHDNGLNNLETLTIHTSALYRGDNSLFDQCSKLKKVIATYKRPPYLGENAEYKYFPRDLENVELVVPDDYDEVDEKTQEVTHYSPKEMYAAADEWSRFGKVVTTAIQGVADTTVDETQISAAGGAIHIATAGTWCVYTPAGQMVKSGSGNAEVQLPRGLYIVRAGKQSCKVALR